MEEVKETELESVNTIYRFQTFRIEELEPKCDSPIPKARSGHRIASYNGKIYSFGGYNPKIDGGDEEMLEDPFWEESCPLFKELWEFNISSCIWRKISMEGSIPNQLASHTSVFHPVYRDCLLIYGGTGNPFGSVTSTAIHACNVNTGKFTKLNILSSQGEPMALYGQSIALNSDGCLYTFGGTTGFQYFMDVNRIDLTSEEPAWERLNFAADPGEPYPRYRHEIGIYNNNIYLLGGGTSSEVCGFQNIATFSIEERHWFITRTNNDRRATIDQGDGNGYPDARRCHGLVQSGAKMYIIGGYDGNEIFNDVWCLDLATVTWKKIHINLPRPVYFHSVTLTEEGRVVVFGGVDSIQLNTRTSQIYSFWITIPSLRNLCWNAVTHYIPNIEKIPTTKLRQIGIPGDCIEKVGSSRAVCG